MFQGNIGADVTDLSRKLIRKARALSIPQTALGKSDFSYIANVKDLLRQAK